MTLRVLALSEMPVIFDGERYHSKESGFFNQLAARTELVGVETTMLTGVKSVVNKVFAFQPHPDRWRQGAAINPHAFDERTRLAERKLAQYEGQYDMILQWHTMFAPGTRFKERDYVITMDNTAMISERYWQNWVPFRTAKGRQHWLDMERETYHHARYLFPWSPFVRQSLIEDYGVPPERVVMASPGFNFDKLPPPPQRMNDVPRALFVGYEFERKGGWVLMAAWREVVRAVPDGELVVVGPRLKRRNLPPGVVWRGRVSDRKEMRRLYEAATVFVMPSLFEPWGHAIVEAMGFGLPCIGVDAFAMPEFIEHGETGYLVALGDSEAIAKHLITLFRQPERARAMGLKAHGLVQAMTWEAMLDTILAQVGKKAAR